MKGAVDISDKAISAIKASNIAMGELMIVFNRSNRAIENWLKNKNQLLTTPTGVEAISKTTGLTRDEILIQKNELENA